MGKLKEKMLTYSDENWLNEALQATQKTLKKLSPRDVTYFGTLDWVQMLSKELRDRKRKEDNFELVS